MNSKTKGSGSAHELPSGRNTGLPNNQQQEQERERERYDVIEKIMNYGVAVLLHEPKEVRNDREFMLEVIKQHVCAVRYASVTLLSDREFMMEVVKQAGWALRYASIELKGDLEIVMTAVNQNGRALRYASVELQGDLEIVMVAVKQYGHRVLNIASVELQLQRSLRSHLEELRENVYNVELNTFLATILFGAKQEPEEGDSSACELSLLRPSVCLPFHSSLQVKQLIWEYAGVRSGPRWELIDGAFSNLPNL
jgi:hypothetical protein